MLAHIIDGNAPAVDRQRAQRELILFGGDDDTQYYNCLLFYLRLPTAPTETHWRSTDNAPPESCFSFGGDDEAQRISHNFFSSVAWVRVMRLAKQPHGACFLCCAHPHACVLCSMLLLFCTSPHGCCCMHVLRPCAVKMLHALMRLPNALVLCCLRADIGAHPRARV